MASNSEGSSVDHPRSTEGSVNRPSPATPLQGQDDVQSDHAGPSQQLEISRQRTQAPGENRSSTAVKGPVTLQDLYILDNSHIDRRQVTIQPDISSIGKEGVDHPRHSEGSVNRPSPAAQLQGQGGQDDHADVDSTQQLDISRQRFPDQHRSTTAVNGEQPLNLQELSILENCVIDRRQLIVQYDNSGIREEDYEVIKGSYYVKRKPMKEGTKIYEGYQSFGSNEKLPVAVKVIFPYIPKNESEVKNLLTLKDHKNIVQIIAAVLRSNPQHQLSIVMELCNKETLQDYVSNRGTHLDIDQTVEYTRHLVAGVEHIHEKGIIHRDLKPDNILFSHDRRYIKIADFGLSKQLQFGLSTARSSRQDVGTDGYRAPETYLHDDIKRHSDIFSLGLVMHVLWTGDHAYGSNRHLWVHLITTDENQDKCDLSKLPNFPKQDDLHNLLSSMLKFLPENRPTIKEVAQSCFFRTDPQLEQRQLSVQNCRDELTVPKQVFQPLIPSDGEVSTDRAPTMPASQPELTVPTPIRSAKQNPAVASSTATAGRNSPSPASLDLPLEMTQENAQIGRGIHDEVSHEDEQAENIHSAAGYAEKQIGPGGGKLEMGQYKLDLPPTALPNETTLFLNEYRSFEEKPLPEGYQHISSIIRCRPTNTKLEVNGNLTMSLNISLAEGMEPIILHSKDQHSPWYNHSTPIFVAVNKNSVAFEISSFGWYVVALNVAGHNSSQIKLKNYLFYEKHPPQLHVITQLADKEPPTPAGRDITSVFCMPDPMVIKSNEEIGYQLVCQSPIECQLSPTTEVKLTGDVINANESKWTTFYLKPAPSRNQKYVHVQYIVSEPNLTQKRQSDLALEWNFDMQSEQMAALPELQQTQGNEGETLRIARSQSVSLQCSTDEFYQSHLGNDVIYQMEPNRTKGRVLIINNEFAGNLYSSEIIRRKGSEMDVSNMVSLWEELGFDVNTKMNLSSSAMMSTIKEFANRSREVSCVVVTLMTHGGKSEDGREYFFGEDGRQIPLDMVIDVFTSRNSPHLQGIPKLFMFQMCRGERWDNIMPRNRQSDTTALMADSATHGCRILDDDETPMRNVVPERSDMLIAYPSQSGYVSFRNTETGSWLINAIANMFRKHAHDTHVMDMLTMVNSIVASRTAYGMSIRNSVQLSNQESYLRKKLYLFPGWPKKDEDTKLKTNEKENSDDEHGGGLLKTVHETEIE